MELTSQWFDSLNILHTEDSTYNNSLFKLAYENRNVSYTEKQEFISNNIAVLERNRDGKPTYRWSVPRRTDILRNFVCNSKDVSVELVLNQQVIPLTSSSVLVPTAAPYTEMFIQFVFKNGVPNEWALSYDCVLVLAQTRKELGSLLLRVGDTTYSEGCAFVNIAK